MMNLCGASDLLRVGTALSEALRNAIDHGNLELSSSLREADDGSYEAMRRRRQQEPPYRDRRVHVETFFSRSEAKIIIRDEGPGFDPQSLPDPTDPENLLKSSGRGIMLMQTFMDDVTFNDRGNEVTLIRRARRRPMQQAILASAIPIENNDIMTTSSLFKWTGRPSGPSCRYAAG